jgi:glycosyltransferase involved in cell wall biosynthesis
VQLSFWQPLNNCYQCAIINDEPEPGVCLEGLVITVLLATRNRAGILEGVLNSYTSLKTPPDSWQVVIVDNGSTDSTPEVVRRFAGRLPVTYVVESKAGKSRAVNAGLRHVAGDLILFTDDDILPCRDWLTHYAAAAASQPDYDVFGGPVIAKWPYEPPVWAVCNKEIRSWCFDHPDPTHKTGPFTGTPIGGNFAVRTRAQVENGGFNLDIGPRPGAYTMGNETEFIGRLRLAGAKLWWIRDAMVEHIIREEQLNKQWMLRRAVRGGRGDYRLCLASEGPPKLILGLPRWVIRASLWQMCLVVAAWARRDEQNYFVAHWHLNYHAGMLIESWRMRSASTALPSGPQAKDSAQVTEPGQKA